MLETLFQTKIIFVFYLYGFGYVRTLGENENFSELLEMVKSNISASQCYIFPKNNSKLVKVKTPIIYDFGTYDFIIIGAGAAGSVIANRLSEISNWTVLLLEAGGDDNDFTKIYSLKGYTYKSDFNWGFNTTSQKHSCLGNADRICYLQHGKVVGGSTTINGGVYARGHPKDYDRIVSEYESPGWSFEEVLPYFKKYENTVFEPKDEGYHGEGGYITIDYPPITPGLFPALTNAFEEIGLSVTDYNGANQSGVSRPQVALKGNERDGATSFLRIKRKNLTISLNSFATKILISNRTKTAHGVIFVKNQVKYKVKAKREIIVAGGGYGSPHILMLSGIGPREHLEKLKIPIKQDLPVGKFFQTHPYYLGLLMRTNKVLYNFSLEQSLKRYVQHLKPLIFEVELMAYTNFGQPQHIRPEIEYWFNVPASSGSSVQSSFGINDDYAKAYASNTTSDLLIAVELLHPKSRGTITLKSNSAEDMPIFDPNMLAFDEDVETLYKGIQFVLQLNNTQTFRDYGAEMIVLDSPYCEDLMKLSKDWWVCSIRHWTVPARHPLGTNSIGSDPTKSVVNPRLQVHGIKNLRVADESILPESISGHNMAPAYMIGEKVADIIKEDHGRP